LLDPLQHRVQIASEFVLCHAHSHVTTMILKRHVMKPDKTFDGVQMKEEIQERLLREVAELGEDEAQTRRAERLFRDPILGGFLGTKMAAGK